VKKISLTTAFCFCQLLALAAVNSPAQPTADTQEEAKLSCRQFVQNFYDWYGRTARDQTKKNFSPVDFALKEKAKNLSPTLFRDLQADREAQRNADEIVGLEFDPFLGAQDVADRYEVEDATPRQQSYRVRVHGIWNGKKRSRPDVIAELARKKNGEWIFVNFYYPGPYASDLVSVLKRLREDRAKPADK
jgi:hypothetical protein